MSETAQISVEAHESVSPRFNAPDAEVVFKSSDGMLYRIHRMNLAACTEGFSPPENSTFAEVVSLSESSHTLELLFQFIYPQPVPELGSAEFDELILLAEAAEKYRVFPAMNLCTIHLMNHLETHTEAVFMHALKHGIHKCATRAAPLLIDRPLEDFLPKLPGHYVMTWVRYHAHWTRTWKFAISSAPAPRTRECCRTCGINPLEYVLPSIAKLNTNLSALQDLDAVFSLNISCLACNSDDTSIVKSWQDALRTEVFSIPDFADIAFTDGSLDSTMEPRSKTKLIDAGIGDCTISQSHGPSMTAGGNTHITFKSSDGVSFYLSEGTVKAWSKSLLPGQYEQPILLPETSSILEFLFRFLVTSPHPDLEEVKFHALAPLSLAAHLYGIYPAMGVCSIYMAQVSPHDLKNSPSVFMDYALKSQNNKLVDKCALLMLGNPLVEMIEIFKDSDRIISWCKYLERLHGVAHDALSFADRRCISLISSPYRKIGNRTCRACDGCSNEGVDLMTIGILRKLGRGAAALVDLEATFASDTFCCPTSRANIELWKEEVEIAIQAIPTFTKYCLMDV